MIAIDTETTGLKWSKKDKPFAVGFAYEDESTNYFDTIVGKDRTINWEESKLKEIIYWGELENPDIPKIFAHAKFDIHMLRQIGINIKGKIHDVLLMAKICNNLEQDIDLKNLAAKYVGIPKDDEKILRDKTVKARNKAVGYRLGNNVAEDYWLVKQIFGTDECETYCRKDCIRNIRLFKFYSQALTEFGLWNIYERELKLMEVVIGMEKRGLYFFKEKCKLKAFQLMEDINNIGYNIKKQYGDVNLNSPKQKAGLLQSLGIPLTEKTDSGEIFATGTPVLKKLRHTHPIIEELLKRSGWENGRKYLVNYLESENSNVLHPTINQFVADTFRFTCENPNLQNVPNPKTSGGEYVVDCRETFGPRPGYIWFVIDYSQLELRIKVSRCGKGALLQAFIDGRDPHNETRIKVPFLAAKEPGVGRKLAKNTNFTLINVGGPGVLHEKYDIPLDEAKEIHDGFHAAYPEIKEHSNELAKFAAEHGYIYNAFNRKLLIRDRVFKYGKWISGYYQATSFDVQGSAADLIKIAMIRLEEKFKELDVHILLQIHDELIIEAKEEYWDDRILMKEIRTIMEDHFGVFILSMPVEFSRTKTHWNEKEKVEL